jgi:hypothetical protein
LIQRYQIRWTVSSEIERKASRQAHLEGVGVAVVEDPITRRAIRNKCQGMVALFPNLHSVALKMRQKILSNYIMLYQQTYHVRNTNITRFSPSSVTSLKTLGLDSINDAFEKVRLYKNFHYFKCKPNMNI